MAPTSDYLVLLLKLKKQTKTDAWEGTHPWGEGDRIYARDAHLYIEISLHTRSMKNQRFFCKCKIASAFFLMESVYLALCVDENDKKRPPGISEKLGWNKCLKNTKNHILHNFSCFHKGAKRGCVLYTVSQNSPRS